ALAVEGEHVEVVRAVERRMNAPRAHAPALPQLGLVELLRRARDLVHDLGLRREVGGRGPLLVEVVVGVPGAGLLVDVVEADERDPEGDVDVARYVGCNLRGTTDRWAVAGAPFPRPGPAREEDGEGDDRE